MPKCDVCGGEFQESQLLRCYDCGKAYCPEYAEKDPTVKELGFCPDCEEVFEAEEDYWGWGEEEEW
jgi:uncharacterized C2H2 Zn-finger protein